MMDGTHGFAFNSRPRHRDQDHGPIAADVKRLQRELLGVPDAWQTTQGGGITTWRGSMAFVRKLRLGISETLGSGTLAAAPMEVTVLFGNLRLASCSSRRKARRLAA